MDGVLGSVLMGAITFPVCFFVARGCLRGLLRMMSGGRDRHVL